MAEAYIKAFGSAGGVPTSTAQKQKQSVSNPLYIEYKEWCENTYGGMFGTDNDATVIVSNIYEGRRFAQNETKYAILELSDEELVKNDFIKEASFIYAYTKATKSSANTVDNRKYNAEVQTRAYLMTLGLSKA